LNDDWIKARVDVPWVNNAEDMRDLLKALGMDVEAFKRLPVYRRALRVQPWLKDL